MEASSDISYMSAPTTPKVYKMENMYFYSVPNSPKSCSFPSQPPTPGTYEDANSTFDEFEFETSRHFILNEDDIGIDVEAIQQQQKQPTMAFADELFFDGKVLPLLPPLKLPPRLQHDRSSTASSPRSPSSVLKIKFLRRSLWNDDFDPFLVALKNVKEENREKIQRNNHRRARSLSPVKSANRKRPINNPLGPNRQTSEHPMGPQTLLSGPLRPNIFASPGSASPKEPTLESQRRLAEPKGLAIARRIRLVKMGYQMTKPEEIKVKMSEKERESEGSYRKERKREKIKNFILRSVSMKKPTILRTLSLKFIKPANCSEEKKMSQLAEMKMVYYRPRLFLCWGYRTKYDK